MIQIKGLIVSFNKIILNGNEKHYKKIEKRFWWNSKYKKVSR